MRDTLVTAPLPVLSRSPAPRMTVRPLRAAARRPVRIRTATPADATAIHALIVSHLAEGHLLPRDLDEIRRHAHRFVVATTGPDVVGCAEVRPLSRAVAEVRSLVVAETARHGRVGHRLVSELLDRAAHAGHETLCAFTHAPSYFVRMGFSLAPHAWLPEKIAADCCACPLFRRCGQAAVIRTLDTVRATRPR